MLPGARLSSSDIVKEATTIVEAARSEKLQARIFGAAAIINHCPKYSYLFDQMGRRPGDIDLASLDKYSSRLSELMVGLGYDEDLTVTAFGSGRLIFRRRSDGLHCDLFLGKLEMSHALDFDHRLDLDYPTLSLADLLLTKLQIFKLNEKDAVDTIVLLREHRVGHSAAETIDADYVSDLCSKDWGLWRTVTGNFDKVAAIMPSLAPLKDEDRQDVSGKLSALKQALDSVPKSFSWKMRARVGESRKWYNEVEDLYRG